MATLATILPTIGARSKSRANHTCLFLSLCSGVKPHSDPMAMTTKKDELWLHETGLY